jgi:hypothetical protein
MWSCNTFEDTYFCSCCHLSTAAVLVGVLLVDPPEAVVMLLGPILLRLNLEGDSRNGRGRLTKKFLVYADTVSSACGRSIAQISTFDVEVYAACFTHWDGCRTCAIVNDLNLPIGSIENQLPTITRTWCRRRWFCDRNRVNIHCDGGWGWCDCCWRHEWRHGRN